jgi:ATP-dependent exoDNAse (exonuclease V) alpha subunit
VTAIEGEKIVLDDKQVINLRSALHLDQGIAMTSHASQGKTVDQVLVSVPVASFSQANQAQFYVSMSRARTWIHLFTDSKVALKEAVTRSSERLSPYEVISNNGDVGEWKNVVSALHSSRQPSVSRASDRKSVERPSSEQKLR